MKVEIRRKPDSVRPSTCIRHLCEAMEGIAPTWAAAEWDNVGLLVGDAAAPVRKVLLAIDLTWAVLDEAQRGRYDAVIAYHPPIFKPTPRMVVSQETQEGIAAAALAAGVAVYSPHTALDAAPGGTNEVLAELAGLRELRPFESSEPKGKSFKLVTFAPPTEVDAVAAAMFDAGAGRIGDYERCSFRLHGEGTFFGTDATDPTVGKKGRLERVDEVRLEVIVSGRSLGAVVAALCRTHSYEEPAFDVFPLATPPREGVGQGRTGVFVKPTTARQVAATLVRATGATASQLVGDARAKVRRGIVCVGAAGNLPFDVVSPACGPGDLVITGEMRHHDALRYARCGATAIALGHWASERPVLKPLTVRLKAVVPGVKFDVSQADRDPFATV